ncbi:hypothetical protein WA158_001389 [Blastocystis sp. Blastoise]
MNRLVSTLLKSRSCIQHVSMNTFKPETTLNYLQFVRFSGHSHWAKIKHDKGKADIKKSATYAKIGKSIMAAARNGTDPVKNLKLKAAISKAKAINMPKDNIERLIKRSQGKDAVALDELTYEAHGPGGVALIIECKTDNKNRTVAQIRHVLKEGGGVLENNGCVQWCFKTMGQMEILKTKDIDDEKLMEAALDSGADDVEELDDCFTISCEPTNLREVSSLLQEKGYDGEIEIAEVPVNTQSLTPDQEAKLEKLLSNLEDLEDVDEVYHNAE